MVAAVAAIGLAIWLLFLRRQVPGPYVPEVAGVVVRAEPAGNNLGRYVLDNGQSFTASISMKETTFVSGGAEERAISCSAEPGPAAGSRFLDRQP